MEMLDRLLPKIGAIIVIVGGLALRWHGIDAEVWALVIGATAFLFGQSYAEWRAAVKKGDESMEEVKNA